MFSFSGHLKPLFFIFINDSYHMIQTNNGRWRHTHIWSRLFEALLSLHWTNSFTRRDDLFPALLDEPTASFLRSNETALRRFVFPEKNPSFFLMPCFKRISRDRVSNPRPHPRSKLSDDLDRSATVGRQDQIDFVHSYDQNNRHPNKSTIFICPRIAL